MPPPEAPLFSAFPEYADLAGKEGRDRLTIQHVLTMTMGTDWDESSLPYSDPRNSEIAMDNAPDRYRYILERRVVDTPGARWTYCGGATALLARIIAKGTGKTLHAFARENLFDPLGMGATEWAAGRDGEPIAASGARMSVRDLARIGIMMLHGGKVGDRAVVPADWVARCITPAISADEVRRYGYQWFVLDIAFGKPKGWARRTAGAHVDGTGRRRPAAVHRPSAATRHCHHRRQLRHRGPVDDPPATEPYGLPLREDEAKLALTHSRNAPDTGAALARIREAAGDAFLVGEVYLPSARWQPYSDHFDAVFAFELLHASWDAEELRRAIEATTRQAGAAWALSNHDFGRLPTRFGPRERPCGGDAPAHAAGDRLPLSG